LTLPPPPPPPPPLLLVLLVLLVLLGRLCNFGWFSISCFPFD
jgi:hypothetical protein